MSEIIQGMEDHQHTPVGFYSDAFEKPTLVKCSECGDTLDEKIITAQDMAHLTSLNVSAWAQLAEAAGVSIREARRLVEQGALDRNPIAVDVFQSMMAHARGSATQNLGDGPADNVKYLRKTENGTQYTP